jgi:hypothetical protein
VMVCFYISSSSNSYFFGIVDTETAFNLDPALLLSDKSKSQLILAIENIVLLSH